MKDRQVRQPGRKYVVLYFVEANQYTTCEARKVIYDEKTQNIEHFVGCIVTIQDLDGKHNGVLKAVGSQQEMLDKEHDLEVEAANRSMEMHAGDFNDENETPQLTHAVVLWVKDGKYSRVRLGKIKYDQHTYGDVLDLVGNVFKTKWSKRNYLDSAVRAVGSKEEMDQQLEFWKKEGSGIVANVLGTNNDESSVEGVLGFEQGYEAEHEPEPSKPARKKKRTGRTGVLDEVQPGYVSLVVPHQPKDVDYVERIAKLEEELRFSKAMFLRERCRAKKLSKRNLGNGDPERVIQVGAGLTITENEKEDLVSYKCQPSLYLNNLNRYTGAFCLEELARSSVTGLRTVTSPSSGSRPGLDARKWGALKAFTIKECGITGDDAKITLFRKKISSICPNARKALARRTDGLKRAANSMETEDI